MTKKIQLYTWYLRDQSRTEIGSEGLSEFCDLFQAAIAQILLFLLLQHVPMAADDVLRGKVQPLWSMRNEGRIMVLLPCVHVEPLGKHIVGTP